MQKKKKTTTTTTTEVITVTYITSKSVHKNKSRDSRVPKPKPLLHSHNLSDFAAKKRRQAGRQHYALTKQQQDS